ncbi:MAG: NTP transferase domain-containing protein, partial [Clostridiales bacterium]|nr:NTP transferase domain-containing protein [Clostridiales bacterium]
MKALILNSGLGKRMGDLTNEHPKCMTELSIGKTIVSRQLSQLADVGITDIVMTTGPFADVLESYIASLRLPINITYVANPVYDKTNYIYSIYMARELLHDDILLMHGDLVFENAVLDGMLEQEGSAMTVSSSVPLPEKDFKAVVEGGRITKVGVEFFDDAVAAQPLYKLTRKDWEVWLAAIVRYCEEDNTNCYAEKALNEVSAGTEIRPYDVGEMLCGEVDNPEDL